MPPLSNEPMFRLPQCLPEKTNCYDVVYTFDTTGSMAPYIAEVKKDLHNRIKSVFKKYQDVKIAIIAHGDYCDFSETYTTNILDFTRNVQALEDFIQNTPNTHGGDAPECYELVLLEVRTRLSWREGSKRQLIMFGDSCPHAYEDYKEIMEEFPQVMEPLDWKDEIDQLVAMRVEITTIQSGQGNDDSADKFWVELAFKARGWRLNTNQPDEILNLCIAALHRGKGEECFKEFMEEVRAEESPRLLERIGGTLARLLKEPGSTDALAPKQKYTYKTETINEWESRTAKEKEERIKNGVVFNFSPIIPKEEVQVGLDLLGKTGNSIVYSGVYKGAKVAVHREWASDPPAKDKYIKDVNLVRRLKHSNVAVVFGVLDPMVDEAGISSCLIMECADNNLYNAAVMGSKGPKINEAILIRYLADAAKGLAYIHSLKMVHKSVRPNSILMVGSVGKLCTSSLAALNEDSIVRYNALELYNEDNEHTSHTDNWAMGITVLEVLVGAPVYGSLEKHENGMKIPSRLHNKQLPAKIENLTGNKRDLVNECLRWEPAERVHSKVIAARLSSLLMR